MMESHWHLVSGAALVPLEQVEFDQTWRSLCAPGGVMGQCSLMGQESLGKVMKQETTSVVRCSVAQRGMD